MSILPPKEGDALRAFLEAHLTGAVALDYFTIPAATHAVVGLAPDASLAVRVASVEPRDVRVTSGRGAGILTPSCPTPATRTCCAPLGKATRELWSSFCCATSHASTASA